MAGGGLYQLHLRLKLLRPNVTSSSLSYQSEATGN